LTTEDEDSRQDGEDSEEDGEANDAYKDSSIKMDISDVEEDSDEAAQLYQEYLQSIKGKETMNVNTSEEADMLIAMTKHANDSLCTIEYLKDVRKLQPGLLLLYQARTGQKNLIESTSIHINYDKLPQMETADKKFGKALELDTGLHNLSKEPYHEADVCDADLVKDAYNLTYSGPRVLPSNCRYHSIEVKDHLVQRARIYYPRQPG
jgi:hypothetical protein